MCYLLYLASPLTLSEIRSMLPPGVRADGASGAEQAGLKAVYPAAQTVAVLVTGPCSCDFVVPRGGEARDDESHLRRRYAKLGWSRDRIIAALERHRLGGADRLPRPLETWRAALVEFVAEHARNAGATLYYLHFGPGTPAPAGPATTIPVEWVRDHPDTWLPEATPTIVTAGGTGYGTG